MTKKYKGTAHERALAAERQARRRAKLRSQNQKTANPDKLLTPAEFLRLQEDIQDRKKPREVHPETQEPLPPLKYALVSDGRRIAWRTHEDWATKVVPHLKDTSEGHPRDKHGNLIPMADNSGIDEVLRANLSSEEYAAIPSWAKPAAGQHPTEYHEWLALQKQDNEECISPEDYHSFLEWKSR
jgi:hypothetical protein